MRDLDLKSLRLLVAACEHRNIRKAAAAEHIEPSAISKRIAQLEHTLGTPLIERGRRGVQPTPAGEALLEHARGVLFALAQMEASVAEFGAGLRGHVRIVASASAIAQALPDDLAAFLRAPAHAGIRVELEERLSTDVARMVRDGSASIGVCWDTVDAAGLQARRYHHDRLALAVPIGHPLADRRAVRFEETLDEQHVVLSPSTAVSATLQRAAARAGRPFGYRAVVSNFDAALRVVAAGLGVSVIPEQVGRSHAVGAAIRVLPLADDWAARSFAILFRDERALAPAARELAGFLAERASGAATRD